MEYLLRKGIEKLEKYNQQQQQQLQRPQQTGQSQYGQQPFQYGQQPQQAQQPLYYQQQQPPPHSPSSPGQQWLVPHQGQQQFLPPAQYQPPRSPALTAVQSAPPPLPPRSAPPLTTSASRPPLPHVLSAPTPVPQQTPYWQMQQGHSDDQALALALDQSLQLTRPSSLTLQPYQHVPPATYAQQPPPQPNPRAAPPRSQTAMPSMMRVSQGGRTQIRKILCLDGGGVRGLASLMIVKNLMERLETQRGGKLEPWQEFDLIGGTSTGGLIAIMLGRLRMSVDQCIEAYISLSKSIFEPVHSRSNIAGRAIAKFAAEGKFNSQALEDQIKHILLEHGFADDEMLQDDDPDAPRVFVTAVQAINTDSVVIRSYKHPDAWDPVSSKARIWQAARATSAASTFFDPITIGNVRYIDGALQDNNPVFKADEESRAIWGEHSDRLIISVGTGDAPGPSFVGNALKLVDALAKLVTSCKKDDERFQRSHREAVDNDRFYRFTVTHGLAEVGLEEWEALEQIEASTNSYLGSEAVSRSFKRCATIMHDAGQRLGFIAGKELRTHLKVQELSSTYCEFCEDCHRGIRYMERMFLCVERWCQMLICSDCHSTHEDAHIKTIIRFSAVQWMENMPNGLRSSAPCQHCANESRSRWECEACKVSLCRRCVSHLDRRLAFFKEHYESSPTHRHFQVTYPPLWTVKNHYLQDPCPCIDIETATSIHCDRCHQYFKLNHAFLWCKTCMTDFGCDVTLCQTCYEEEEEHRTTHSFGVCDIIYAGEAFSDKVEESVKKMWRCQQCPEVIPDGRYWLHRHMYLTLAVDPVIAEQMRRLKFVECDRRAWKASSQAQDDPIGTWQCNYCCKLMGFQPLNGQLQSSFCTTCSDSFCTDCTAANRCGHRHPLIQGPIRRPPANDFGPVTCNLCSTAYMLRTYSGLWCSDCKNFLCCGACFDKLRQSGGKNPVQGLRHTKVLNDCKTRIWVLYINK